jgi:hypothetical protein
MGTSKLQIHPLVREGAPHEETRSSQINKKKSAHEFQMEAHHEDRLAD